MITSNSVDNSTYIVFKYHYKDVPPGDPQYTTCVKEEEVKYPSLKAALVDYYKALNDPLMEATFRKWDERKEEARVLTGFEMRRKEAITKELDT